MSISFRPLAGAALLAFVAAPLAAQEQPAAPAALPPANVCDTPVLAPNVENAVASADATD
jgi:hypothetical protein